MWTEYFKYQGATSEQRAAIHKEASASILSMYKTVIQSLSINVRSGTAAHPCPCAHQ